MKQDKKTRVLVLSLIAVIAVLLGLILYMFVIKPSFTGYAVKLQGEGVTYAVASIMEQAQTCQVVPLTVGDTTMNMVWVDCLQ